MEDGRILSEKDASVRKDDYDQEAVSKRARSLSTGDSGASIGMDSMGCTPRKFSFFKATVTPPGLLGLTPQAPFKSTIRSD